MTTPTSGAAIQRYKIGYREDEWGQRSSTPGGIPDASGSWVRYADHVTALAGQAKAAQSDLITIRNPTTRAEMKWLLKLAHLVISDVNKTLDDAFAPAQPAAPQPAPSAQAADSVQEDAARYRLLRRGQHWSVIDGIGNDLRAEALDAAVDAARKRGATQ